MSKDWKVTNVESPSSGDRIEQVITGGIVTPTNTYTVTNTKTGEEHTVEAYDEKHLGEKIERGDFSDKK